MADKGRAYLALADTGRNDGRLELAIGAHAANNLFIALVANYEESVLATTAIFTTSLDPAYAMTTLPVAGLAFYALVFRARRKPGQGFTRTGS